MRSKGFLKIQLFHRFFSKILSKHSRTLTERSPSSIDTCLKLEAIFHKIVIILLVKKLPDNKFFDVTNKKIKNVMWSRC